MNGQTKLIFPGLAGFYTTWTEISYTLVRIVIGIMFIMHGLPKWNNGIERVGNAFATNYGLPRWFAAIAVFFELVGGACLVVGLFTRFFAAALAIEMLIAMFAAHWPKGYSAGAGGYEYVLLIGVVCFAIAIRGGGCLSVDRAIGKEL